MLTFRKLLTTSTSTQRSRRKKRYSRQLSPLTMGKLQDTTTSTQNSSRQIQSLQQPSSSHFLQLSGSERKCQLTGQRESSSGYQRREHSATATTGAALYCCLYQTRSLLRLPPSGSQMLLTLARGSIRQTLGKSVDAKIRSSLCAASLESALNGRSSCISILLNLRKPPTASAEIVYRGF